MKIRRNGLYVVKYNGKYVVNHAFKEPLNANKFTLGDFEEPWDGRLVQAWIENGIVFDEVREVA